MNRSSRAYSFAAASWLLACSSVLAQASAPAPPVPQTPCSSAAARQLDFWLGRWQGRWIDGRSGKPQSAINTVTTSHGGCVVQEQFRQEGEQGLVGTSLSVFDTREERWRQTWVDNQGSYLDFRGGLEGGVMTLGRSFTTRDQRLVHQRMRFVDVQADRFEWQWQRSLDDGRSWETVWTIRYERLGNLP